MVNEAVISALAALSGSVLGGVTPIVSNYLIQRSLTQRELQNRQLADRQSLYSDFIQFGIKVYVNATTKNPEDENMDDLVSLHALISRMRLYSSPRVVDAAEEFARLVTTRYGSRAMSVEEFRNATLAPHVDPLNDFSNRCREELGEIFRGRYIR